MAQIRAIVFVTDPTQPVDIMVADGELPGPYADEAEALEQIDEGQAYRVVGDVLYAQAVRS